MLFRMAHKLQYRDNQKNIKTSSEGLSVSSIGSQIT